MTSPQMIYERFSDCPSSALWHLAFVSTLSPRGCCDFTFHFFFMKQIVVIERSLSLFLTSSHVVALGPTAPTSHCPLGPLLDDRTIPIYLWTASFLCSDRGFCSIVQETACVDGTHDTDVGSEESFPTPFGNHKLLLFLIQ